MLDLEEIAKSNFPNENILHSFSGSLKKEVNKIFNIPLSYFIDPIGLLYKGNKDS